MNLGLKDCAALAECIADGVSLGLDPGDVSILERYQRWRRFDNVTMALGMEFFDKMFSNEIRMGAFKALTKYQFKEGIAAGVHFAKTQGGHGSERRTGEIMKELVTYGAAARGAGCRSRRAAARLSTKDPLPPAFSLPPPRSAG